MKFYIDGKEVEFNEFNKKMKTDLKIDKDGDKKSAVFLKDMNNNTRRNNYTINNKHYEIVRR